MPECMFHNDAACWRELKKGNPGIPPDPPIDVWVVCFMNMIMRGWDIFLIAWKAGTLVTIIDIQGRAAKEAD